MEARNYNLHAVDSPRQAVWRMAAAGQAGQASSKYSPIFPDLAPIIIMALVAVHVQVHDWSLDNRKIKTDLRLG